MSHSEKDLKLSLIETPLISFCTTCMGRLEHLKCTLPENIQTVINKRVEFVLLNYSSPDSCEEWANYSLGDWIKSGIVSYYRYDGARCFHHSHAKNLAHRLARGQIVCNVDADNYIGKGFFDYLLEVLYPSTFVRSTKGEVFGRMAFFKSDFYHLGGYDERMKGWGTEDLDLSNRAKLFGLKQIVIRDPSFLRHIHHDNNQRVSFLSQKKVWRTDQKHRRMSAKSIARGDFIANSGANWGHGNVVKLNFVNQQKPIFSDHAF